MLDTEIGLVFKSVKTLMPNVTSVCSIGAFSVLYYGDYMKLAKDRLSSLVMLAYSKFIYGFSQEENL